MFLKANLTAWMVGYIVPAHAQDIYEIFGCGLGVFPGQGREAKHQDVYGYFNHTPATNGCPYFGMNMQMYC